MREQIVNLADKAYWGEGGGYYQTTPDEVRRHPLPLPSQTKTCWRKLAELVQKYLPHSSGATLLEVGCGGSTMLPYFAKRWRFRVMGIDYDEFAAELARANLEGHGVDGLVYCRDVLDVEGNKDLHGQFDIVCSGGFIEHFHPAVEALKVISRFLKPGGFIFTIVPNFQGINWLVQRLVDNEVLQMHVVHSLETLRTSHELAGFKTLACKYLGVYNGFLTEGARCKSALKRRLHATFSRTTNMAAYGLIRATNYRFTPEHRWFSPWIGYVGTHPGW